MEKDEKQYPCQKISAYIHEFSSMGKGVWIKNHKELITLDYCIQMSRTGLKHLVESRTEDGYTPVDMEHMIARIPCVIDNPDFDIQNPNQSHCGSRIAGKLYSEERRGLLVIYQPAGEIKTAFNAYYRGEEKYRKIKRA